MSNEDVQASTSRITSSAPSVTLPRARSSSTTALHRSEVFDQKCKDDETRSQQVNMLVSPARIPLLKRALSFQFGNKSSESVEKLERELRAKIRMRYRDVAKFVIWPECTLPKEYNRGYVSYNEDKSKRTAIRYTHAGNHQSAVLRLNKASPKWSDTEVRKKLLSGELDTSAFIHPAGLKQDRSKFYHQSPSLARPPGIGLSSVREERSQEDQSNEQHDNFKKGVVSIDDDRTPQLPNQINAIRRSESSDEDESIIAVTTHSDDNAFTGEGDIDLGTEKEPDIQILRL